MADEAERNENREPSDGTGQERRNGNRTITRLRSIFLYCGLSKELYDAVKPRIVAENNRNMNLLSAVTTIFGGLMTVLSLAGAVSRRVLPAYLFLLVSSVVFIEIRRYRRLHGKTSGLMTSYLQCGALLLYGIFNSAVFSPDPASLGVTYCVLLLIPAFILLDRPARECPILIISTLIYLLAVYACKDPSTYTLEITNSLSFTLVGCLCFLTFTSRLVRNLSDRLYIEQERDMDPLTKVQTRRSAVVMIHAQLDRGAGGSFFLIDVDDFKLVNDTRGHLYGDEVLQRLASCISRNVRRMDIVGRYGGDEFIVFLPTCPVAEAAGIAETILKTVKKEFAGEAADISCSIGVTHVSPNESMDTFFRRADEAAYEVKKNGKGLYMVN